MRHLESALSVYPMRPVFWTLCVAVGCLLAGCDSQPAPSAEADGGQPPEKIEAFHQKVDESVDEVREAVDQKLPKADAG